MADTDFPLIRHAEAEFNQAPILSIDGGMLDYLKSQALAAPRRRYRLCLHADPGAPTQEMIIVCPRGTFMTPHRHPDGKSESYHVIEGTMRVCFLTDGGTLDRAIDLGAPGTGLPFLYRLSASRWHMPIVLSDWLVYHETYSGPFVREADVIIHPTAPDEQDPAAIRHFLAALGQA